MSHFGKDFGSFTRDYRFTGQAGIPEVVSAILPVTVVDDCREFEERTWPTYIGGDIQVAVAAVYALVGLHATTLPLQVIDFEVISLPATGNVHAIVGVADLRTANQADGTGDVPRWIRGQAAPTGEVLRGTTTVAPGGGAVELYDAAASRWIALNSLFGQIIRPGEWLWAECGTVNEGVRINIAWKELLFTLPTNPTQI